PVGGAAAAGEPERSDRGAAQPRRLRARLGTARGPPPRLPDAAAGAAGPLPLLLPGAALSAAHRLAGRAGTRLRLAGEPERPGLPGDAGAGDRGRPLRRGLRRGHPLLGRAGAGQPLVAAPGAGALLAPSPLAAGEGRAAAQGAEAAVEGAAVPRLPRLRSHPRGAGAHAVPRRLPLLRRLGLVLAAAPGGPLPARLPGRPSGGRAALSSHRGPRGIAGADGAGQ